VSGAPDVMVVAVVTSPVLAVKVPFGTKLKAMLIGIAQAGVALTAATTITLRTAVRRQVIFMIVSLKVFPFHRMRVFEPFGRL
jgi:hypothetical protein